MTDYNIIIHLDNNPSNTITLDVKFEKDYELRRNITSIGINGILQPSSSGQLEEYYQYIPPHRISSIEVKKITPQF